MESKYNIRQSENGHQFFVTCKHEGRDKINRVFYSKARAEEYIKVATIVENSINKAAK